MYKVRSMYMLDIGRTESTTNRNTHFHQILAYPFSGNPSLIIYENCLLILTNKAHHYCYPNKGPIYKSIQIIRTCIQIPELT